jgi:hypothetical protein
MGLKELNFDDLLPPEDDKEKKRRTDPYLNFQDLLPPVSATDRVLAPVQGLNKGFLTDLPGMPVDTAANAIDQMKALYGVLMSASPATMRSSSPSSAKPAPPVKAEDLPEITPREQIPMSGAWLADMIRKGGGSGLIDVNRPDDALSRYLHAGAAAVGTSALGFRAPTSGGTIGSQIWNPTWRWLAELGPAPYNPAAAAAKTPNLTWQALKDLSIAGGSGAAAQGAAEKWPDNPALSVLAGFGPQAAAQGAAMGVRGGMRGSSGDIMGDRLAALRGAGVETPSVGLASGKRWPQFIESALSRFPGGAGVIAQNKELTQSQMGARQDQLAGMSAQDRGPERAGKTAQSAVEDYRAKQKAIEEKMLNRVQQVIDPAELFPMNATLAQGGTAIAPIPGMPSMTGTRDRGRQTLNDIVASAVRDSLGTPGTPPTTQQVPTGLLDAKGNPIMTTVTIPGTPGRPPGVPFSGLRQTKTLIGEYAYPAAGELVHDKTTGSAKLLYGGAKEDITRAAEQSDLNRMISTGQVGPMLATTRMARADKFWNATQAILKDTLGPIYDARSPEAAYGTIESSARNAPSVTRQIMSSLPKEVRSQVAATVIDGLGRAKSGQQTDAGTQFSSETFLTNWDKIKPEARKALFSGYKNADTVTKGLDDIAAAAGMIRKQMKVWPNASNTTAAAAQLGVIGGTGAALFSGEPAAIALALSTPALAYGGAKLMTSPMFVDWLAKTTTLPPHRIQQHLARLAVNSTSEKDPETRRMMQEFVTQMSQQGQQ